MPRFTIDDGGPIHIAYGYDMPKTGVFLSVFDRRLKWSRDATTAVNAVTEAIGVMDGGGSYFDLHTGIGGFGIKVEDKVMITFLRRYGVPEKQIRALPLAP